VAANDFKSQFFLLAAVVYCNHCSWYISSITNCNDGVYVWRNSRNGYVNRSATHMVPGTINTEQFGSLYRHSCFWLLKPNTFANFEVPAKIAHRNFFFAISGVVNQKPLTISQRPYAMLKAPVPSITVVKQHWAQSVLGWVTAYKRVNHTKDWLALLLARCWSHREEGIKKHTPSAWRVALWDPSVGSGPNSAGSVWPAGNNGHASLRDAWKQTNKQTTYRIMNHECSGKRLMVCWKIWGFWNSFSYKIVLKTLKIPWGGTP
jgi:hypothetical protein